MSMMDSFSAWFWDERLWFPPGVNWSTLQTTEFEKYPDFSDLWYPIFYAFIIILIRFCFEWLLARPLGRLCGIQDTSSELPVFFHRLSAFFATRIHNGAEVFHADDSVNDTHQTNGCLPNGDASSHVRHSPHRTRTRSGAIVHLVHHKSTLDKFSESCWRGTYYLGVFIYGIYVLWDKPWFWDTMYCWHGYPFQPIDWEVWWYYMIEAGFYWSLMFSQFVDVQRKDFWVNFVHHIATILLIYFSWADNFVRIGTLVLVVHDAVDFWMEFAKMARYCKLDRVCNALFIVFTVVWFITRMGVYPFRIIYSALVEAPALLNWFAAYYTFNFLLLVLQVLHIFWSILILRIAIIAVRSGQTDDVRSDEESSDCEGSAEENKPKRPRRNGNNNVVEDRVKGDRGRPSASAKVKSS